jgi:hypothetical protein
VFEQVHGLDLLLDVFLEERTFLDQLLADALDGVLF